MTPRARLNVTSAVFAVAFAALDALDVSRLAHAALAFALFLGTTIVLRRGWTEWQAAPQATSRPRIVEMGLCVAAAFGAVVAFHLIRPHLH